MCVSVWLTRFWINVRYFTYALRSPNLGFLRRLPRGRPAGRGVTWTLRVLLIYTYMYVCIIDILIYRFIYDVMLVHEYRYDDMLF